MASDPDYLNFFAYEGPQGQHGSWNDVHSMQRSDSNATTCTVDSSYTATSSLSGYSSTTEYSAGDFTWAPDGTYQKASVYPLGHLHDHHDVSHMVFEAGSQHQHSGYQLPQPSHQPGRSEQFTTRAGREDAAWTATLAANTLIIAQRPYGDGGPTFISSEALEEALQGYLRCGADEPVRPAVQDVLYQQLHPRIHDVDSYFDDIMRILEQAAYQLQIRLQCPEVLAICYYSLATVLTKLIVGDPEEESKGPTIVEAVDSRDTSSIPAPTQAEKEKFRCQHPGCTKTASRQADLERHFKIVHLKDEQKKKYLCDHKTCARNMTPFFRQDHFRDHLRITHMEDLVRRGNKGDAEWWASRAMPSNWWRCNRCLLRVSLDKHGFVCHRCGIQCEKERQEYRLNAVGRH